MCNKQRPNKCFVVSRLIYTNNYDIVFYIICVFVLFQIYINTTVIKNICLVLVIKTATVCVCVCVCVWAGLSWCGAHLGTISVGPGSQSTCTKVCTCMYLTSRY